MKSVPLMLAMLSLSAFIACSKQNIEKPRDAMLVPFPDYAGKIKFQVLKNAGDKATAQSSYRMVGVGDGIGDYLDGDKVIVVMNHELNSFEGSKDARKRHQTGAFVSKWTLNKNTHAVINGQDLSGEINFYDKNMPAQGDMDGYDVKDQALTSLCSGDMPAQSALMYRENGNLFGTQDKLFFSGEETNTGKLPPENRQGLAFAHVVSGQYAGKSYELPAFGRMAFENILLNPFSQQKTIAMLMDDASNKTYTKAWSELTDDDKISIKVRPPSELYVYIGEKEPASEHPIAAAGLMGGTVYAVRVFDADCPADDDNAAALSQKNNCLDTPNGENRQVWLQGDKPAEFELRKVPVPTGDVDGSEFQLAAYKQGATQFLRLEDGAWDPRSGHENQFYFITTDKIGGNSRLYKLTFEDIKQPEDGGSISIVINGNPQYSKRKDQKAMVMMDNLTIDPWGRILIQEDPGNDQRLARIWLYDIDRDDIKEIAQANPRYFQKSQNNAADFITLNEESTGVVQAFDTLGEGWYLLNMQVHTKHPDSEIVEQGQFMAMYVPRDI